MNMLEQSTINQTMPKNQKEEEKGRVKCWSRLFPQWTKDVKGRNGVEMFFKLMVLWFKIGWGLW